jgi:hypothetical protein
MFVMEGDRYLPTDRARGPWNDKFLHGGAAAGLLAHALDSTRGDSALISTKMTFDLMRPVPVAPLSIDTQVVRDGRRVRYVDATIHWEGNLIARGSAVMQRPDPSQAGAFGSPSQSRFDAWEALPLTPWMNRPDERKLFHTGLEIRMLREPYTGQPMAVWARVPYDFLPGRPLTPIEHAATLSDLANGVGIMSSPGPIRTYINGEITLYLLRPPEGDWVLIESVGRGEHRGIATSNVNFYDVDGLVGHVSLASMTNAVPE